MHVYFKLQKSFAISTDAPPSDIASTYRCKQTSEAVWFDISEPILNTPFDDVCRYISPYNRPNIVKIAPNVASRKSLYFSYKKYFSIYFL